MPRREWIVEVTRAFQILAGQLLGVPANARLALLEALVERIPEASDPFEKQLLEGWRSRARLECDRQVGSGPATLGERLRSYVDAHLSERLTLKVLADAFGVSSRAAADAFYHGYGISVAEYVRDQRFKAAQILLASGLKVEAVSLCAGFGSRTTLYRSIRKRTGVTPRNLTAAEPGVDRGSPYERGRRLPDITREPCASCRRLASRWPLPPPAQPGV